MASVTNKTILFFATNAVGHVHSVLALADKFRDEPNYRTVFMTIGPTIEVVRDHGHELIELEEAHAYEAEVDGEKRSYPGYKRWPQIVSKVQHLFNSEQQGMFFGFFSEVLREATRGLIENHDAIEQAIASVQPDLIVFDMIAAPVCVVKNQHVCPWVNLRSLQPLGSLMAARADGIKPPAFLGAKIFTREERQRLAREEPEKWAEILRTWKEQDEHVRNEFFAGIAPMAEFYKSKGEVFNVEVHANSPFLNLYHYPEALDYSRDDDVLVYPPRWFRCDSLVRQPIGKQDAREIEYWWKRLCEARVGKKEVIYFSLGSIASCREDLIQRYVDYLREDKSRLYVISKGVKGDLIELAADNMIGANYLPQTFFLEHVKLAIVHGGNNTISECIYFGKPMIVLPMFVDQLDNAQRVEDVGLGCRLDLYRCTKQELRCAIEKLSTDAELATRMSSIGEKMRSSDNLDRALSLLKILAEEKSLDEEIFKRFRP